VSDICPRYAEGATWARAQTAAVQIKKVKAKYQSRLMRRRYSTPAGRMGV